ncbi:hypothetical protein WAK64_04415 [Bacillus spongiae]|uniref:Uncharacterized protein n=1 Tax=Bacillus spongiae TaxID=2683610 RepID=A0ABU8HAF1_9BACI
MLTTKIVVPTNESFSGYSSPYIRNKDKSEYFIYLAKADKKLATIQAHEDVVLLQYSPDLELQEFIIIHDVIVDIQKKLKAEVDDTKSFMGYTEAGESAFMIRNWNEWIVYIKQSMENCQ